MGFVVVVDVGGDEVGCFGIGTGHQHSGHTAHIGRQTGRNQLGHGIARGHQHLAAHVAAFFHGGELVLEMHASRTGIDHGLHQFEGVEHAAEARLGIGHDGGKVIDVAGVPRILALGPLDLVGAGKGVVDAAHDLRHGVGRIQ